MWWLLFSLSFILMEFNAWWLHKYVMHGPLWILHRDHHQPRPGQKWQRNDFFALVFAIPSFLLILSDHIFTLPLLGAVGFGVMAYGGAYFFIHEVFIHRRWRFPGVEGLRKLSYFRLINSIHKVHHSVEEKEGAVGFGMLSPVGRNWVHSSLGSPAQALGAEAVTRVENRCTSR